MLNYTQYVYKKIDSGLKQNIVGVYIFISN